MTDAEFTAIFGLSQTEKEQLAAAVSEEIVLSLDDSNQDDYELSQDETELFDNEAYLNDTEEAA